MPVLTPPKLNALFTSPSLSPYSNVRGSLAPALAEKELADYHVRQTHNEAPQ